MPTMQQLPQALTVDPADEVLVAQSGATRVLTVGTLLGNTQARLTLAPGTLLGRAGYFSGGPQPIGVGDGLVVAAGTLSADTTALALLDSPGFTGNPTAPTPPAGDSSDAIATTAFVQANLPRLSFTGDLVGGGAGSIAVAFPTITTPGTFTAITVNAKGLVTSGTALGPSDVDAALGYVPYNASNPANYISAAGLDVFPVLSYGAFFDGVHDDQPGIAAAIAAAHAAGGGTVLLPAGKGRLGSTLSQTYDNVHVVGAGVATMGHNSTPSYDIGTVLAWTGSPGGTMAIIGPAQDLVAGRTISNCDLRGVMFDCASRAGVGVLIASVVNSKFDLGYYQPGICGVHVGTVLLKDQTSATGSYSEPNDTQHNTFRILGQAVNGAATTVAIASSGALSVPVANAAGLYAGLQVRVGAGLYIVQSISGNTLVLATALAAADGAVGSTVYAAPRGVWVHGLTQSDFPSGVYAYGSASYPQVYAGNVSLNTFESVTLVHYTGGDGFTFGYSDHNFVDMLTIYSGTGGTALVFDGSHVAGAYSGQNQVRYCSAGSIVARGTTSYPNASGGTQPDSAYTAKDCYIGCLDSYNGTAVPTVEPGATLRYVTDTDFHGGARLLAPVIYEATWEPFTGTAAPSPTTSLTLVNNSSDHLRFAMGVGTYGWSVNIDGGQGNLRIAPSGGSVNATLVLGSGSAPVAAAGALSAASISTTGTMSSGSATIAGGLTVDGSLAVAGVLTASTPAVSDSSAQAATTAWVAAKGYMQQVATLAALRAVAVAGLADGTALMLNAYAARGDGGAGVFTWNAAATGTDNSGVVVNPTGNAGAGRWMRQLADGRVTPQMFGAKGDGVTNDTAAFAAALLAGPVIVPNGTYRIANLTIPNGAWMEGGGGLGYSGDVASSPGTGQKAAVVTPVLLAVAGTTTCILNVYGSNDATLKGLFLDGGANTPICDGVSSGSTQLMMERVTVVRCVNGLGSISNTDLYTHVATLINCEFANNGNGISNLIDTAMIGGAVSANTVGVNLGSGANANSFIAVRFEWSINDGISGYNAASNVFCGGLFDRNAWRAVNLGAGCKDWTFVGVQFARNGSNNSYPNNSHVALNGTTSVFFNGCVSRTGTNDDGTGTLSPAYFVNYINTNALVTISGCDVSGFVTGFAFGTTPTSYVQRDNFGAGDTFVNAARPFMAGGVVAQTLFVKAPATVAPGASTTIAMSQSPITTNYSSTTRTLHFTAVNNNSPYQSCSARIALGFYRDTTIHAPSGSAAYGETGGTGVVTWGGSGKLQLSASSVASDGSSWTLGILNGGSGDGSNWSVFAELH